MSGVRGERLAKLEEAVRLQHARGVRTTAHGLAASAQLSWGCSAGTAREYVDDLLRTRRLRVEEGMLMPGAEREEVV